MTSATENRPLADAAQVIAENVVPDVTEALELIRLQGPIEVGNVQDGDGTVLITLRWGRVSRARRRGERISAQFNTGRTIP
ncbi:hypothetical protein ACGFR6_14460 [Streptomyces sp. NPDC048567]|uniref:hypothetical protein n=1 Tax=Streptomyces sp. NPDC048567 TaxID=3365570 RepID=UPI003721458D